MKKRTQFKQNSTISFLRKIPSVHPACQLSKLVRHGPPDPTADGNGDRAANHHPDPRANRDSDRDANYHPDPRANANSDRNYQKLFD